MNYKKPAFWVVVVSVVAVAAIGIGLMANPKSSPTLIPKSNEVTSISVEQINEGESLGVIEAADKNQIETILKALQNTNKTMQESVSDLPKRDSYFQINVNGYDSLRFYLYNDDEQYFIEEPYVGIYKTNRETSVSIAKIYTANGGADVKNASELSALLPALQLMVDGVWYQNTGKEVSENVDSNAILGKMTLSFAGTKKLTENGQCNFGSGLDAKFATYDDGVAVFLENKWFFSRMRLTIRRPTCSVCRA